MSWILKAGFCLLLILLFSGYTAQVTSHSIYVKFSQPCDRILLNGVEQPKATPDSFIADNLDEDTTYVAVCEYGAEKEQAILKTKPYVFLSNYTFMFIFGIIFLALSVVIPVSALGAIFCAFMALIAGVENDFFTNIYLLFPPIILIGCAIMRLTVVSFYR